MKVLIVYFHHFAHKFILQRLNISMCHFLNTICNFKLRVEKWKQETGSFKNFLKPMTSIAQVALPSPTKIGIVFFFFPNKIESINLKRQYLFFTIADVGCYDWCIIE